MSKQEKPPTEKKPAKTYHFRMYPTHKQERTLEKWLVLCCETYNAALDERTSAYRLAGVSLSYEDQCAELPACKEVRPDVASVPSQVLQDVVKRVDLAFQAFFGRVEEGKKPGFPRFKSRWRYHSLTFKQFGNSFKIHEQHVPPSEEEVGIDVGLKTFAYLSKEEAIANQRFFREEEAKLARSQRNLSKAPKGSNERERARKIVARTHERIANRRKNFIEQEVCKLVARFGFIAIEALVVRNMVKNPKLAKSIADVSWSMFFTRLVVKAEEAGRHVVKVDPAYTSQTCSACGHRQPMPLSVRVYECAQCGLVIHRDHNGSLNILADARQAVGRHSRVIPEAPGLQPWGVVTLISDSESCHTITYSASGIS